MFDDVFVPAHRSILAAGLLDGCAPAISTGPMRRIPMMAFYYPNMSAMMLGAAEGAHRIAVAATKEPASPAGGVAALLESDAARVQQMAKARDQAPTRAFMFAND
ncbi:MAG: hypothetical protein ABIU95_04140, partial [Burkholderiales bacterium]